VLLAGPALVAEPEHLLAHHVLHEPRELLERPLREAAHSWHRVQGKGVHLRAKSTPWPVKAIAGLL
jgi:hypothetical protein